MNAGDRHGSEAPAAVALLGGPPETLERARALLEEAGMTVGGDAPGAVVSCWPQTDLSALDEAVGGRGGDERAIPLVAVIAAPPTPHLTRALTSRLEGSVLTDDLERALVPAVRSVLSGQSSHPVALRDQLARPLLSAREKQVLAMVVLGFGNAEIASKLFLTEASIKAHLTSSFAKLGVRSREAATAVILDPDAGLGPGILRITPDRDDRARAD